MEISIDHINERKDPYQLFIDSIKSKDTARKYKKDLHKFLLAIPVKVYQDTLGKLPQNKDLGTLANFFVELSRKDPDLGNNIIAAFIKEEKKLVDAQKINPNTLANHIKPMRVLLDSNRIAIHWKSVRKLLPRGRPFSSDRAYTKEELQKMIEVSPDLTDKLIIQIFSSGGFRVEAWNYFTWKDVVFFKNKDNSHKGAALLVYRGDPESYWTFITPEACKTLDLYKEKWKSGIGVYPRPNDPLLKAVKYPTIHRLNAVGVRRRLEKIVRQIGLRPPLPPGRKRHDVPLDHGFRKYFNTMMRRAKVNYLDKEDMMGHKVGLERHYERYQEEDFERFPEYQKAIPFLTISEEEGLRFENQQKQQELEGAQKRDLAIDDLTKRVNELETGPKPRHGEYLRDMVEYQDKIGLKMLSTLLYFWFETRATEEEKRIVWKKMQDAKKKGVKLDISDLFGESSALSWKNFPSAESFE